MVGDGKVGTDAALLLRCLGEWSAPEDRERVEFPSVKAAKGEAPATLPAIAQGYLSKGDHKYLEIRIRDEAKSQFEGGVGSCYQAPEQAWAIFK
jgi:hypothetical protein